MITVFNSKLVINGSKLSWQGMRGETVAEFDTGYKDLESRFLHDMTGFPKPEIKTKKKEGGIELWI